MADVYQADDLTSADQVVLSDWFKIPFLGEPKLIKSLVMLSLAYVTPFWASCFVFNRNNGLTSEVTLL